jgi:hypothetical protein
MAGTGSFYNVLKIYLRAKEKMLRNYEMSFKYLFL